MIHFRKNREGINQKSGTTKNDFTKPITYTVVATDDSSADYTVYVTVAKNSEKSITSYSLNGTAGVITGQNIAVQMPAGTDFKSLIATSSITGKSINITGTNQTSGTTANDFTKPVTYTVVAADGTTTDYTVTVTTIKL